MFAVEFSAECRQPAPLARSLCGKAKRQDETADGSYFTSGQPPSFRGRNALSAGIVAATLKTSHSLIDSAGVLTCSKYIGCVLRPSSRIEPFPNNGSSAGSAFIAATIARPSAGEPTFSTAFK